MATISNATTGNDILVPTNDDVTYRGLSGDDVYILSSAIAANAKISIVDTAGANRIQLVDGLSIASSRFAADAVELTLSNGAVVTVNGADNFTFEVGGNDTSGTTGTDQTYSGFASAMGVASLPTGSTLVAGTANVSVAGASIGSGVGAGSTTVLTTGYDELTGGAGNDTYIGVIGSGTTLTMNSYDVIDGGDGSDTVSLNLSDGNYSGDTTISNVETMSIRASGAARTADLLQQGGVTTLTNDRSTDDLTVSGLPNVVDVNLDRVTNGKDTVVTFDLLALFGEGTSVNLDLAKSGASSEITLQGSAGTTDGIEKLFVSTSGGGNSSASFIKALGASGGNSTLTEFHVSGAKKLTVTTAIDFAGTASGALTTGTISAAESTGGVALAATAGENVVFVGGSGNDSIDFTNGFNVYDSVNGGDGTDTIKLNGAASWALSSLGSITNTEILQVEGTSGGGTTVTKMDTATLTTINFVENDTDAQALTASDLKAGDSVGIIQNNAVEPGTVTLGLKDASGSDDSLTLTLYGQDAAIALADNGIDDLSIASIETLNIVSDVVLTLGNEQLKSTEGNTISDISADTALTTINASGNDKLIMTVGSEATALTTLDMSGMTYDTTATLAAGSVAVTLGSGNDIIAFGTSLTSGDSVTDSGNRTATTADRLTATIAGLSTVTGTGNLNISGVENVDLTTITAASSISAANITGASAINVGSSNAVGLTIKDLPAGLTVGVGNAADASNDIFKGTLTVSLADETGTADNITFLLGDTGTNEDVDAILVTNAAVEQVTITASSDLVDAANNDADLDVSGVKAATLVINGGDASYLEDLDLTNGGNKTLHVNTATVNAAAHTGTLDVDANAATPTTFTAQGVVAQTFTGGSKNDTIDLTVAGGTATHVINGGAGTDTVKLSYTGAANVASISNVEDIEVTIGASATGTLTQGGATFTNDTDAKTLTIKGGNSLSTFSLGATNAITTQTLTKIDASAFEGRINALTFADDDLVDTTQIIGGSSAKDTVTFGSTTADKEFILNVQDVEYLKYTHDTGDTSGETTTLNLSKADGLTNIYLLTGTGAANNVTVTNYDSADHGTVYLGHASGTSQGFSADASNTSTLTVTHASATGTDDTTNLFLLDTNAATGTTGITSAGTENLNITVGADAESHSLVLTNVTPTTGSKTTVTVNGYLATASSAATLTLSTTSTGTTTVNAGTFAGTFSLTDRGAVAMTITGSLGVDTIQMEHEGDTISAQTGVDNLDVNYYAIISGITVDLSKTDDQITSFDGAATSGTVTGFENVDLTDYTGGFGANITAGSSTAGTYILEGTFASDAIYGGLGDDRIIYNDTNGASVDTVYNFTKGGATDTIIVDISDVQTASALVSSVTAVMNDGSAAAAAAGTMTIIEASGATTISSAANDLIVVVGATFTADTLGTAFEAGGNRVLTINSTASDVGDTILTLYSDGTDAYLAAAVATTEDIANTAFESDDLTIVNLVKISGITSISASDFVAADFEFVA